MTRDEKTMNNTFWPIMCICENEYENLHDFQRRNFLGPNYI